MKSNRFFKLTKNYVNTNVLRGDLENSTKMTL